MDNLSNIYGSEFSKWVHDNSSERKVSEGEYLVKEGEEIEYIYLSDRISAIYQAFDERKGVIMLDNLEPYELSGLDSLLTLSPPISNIVSTSNSSYTQIAVKEFIQYIESPNLMETNFIRKYAQKLSMKLQLRNDLLSSRDKEKIAELKKILLFFGDLDELDIAWLQKVGKHCKYKDQEIIIKENKNVPFIYIILSGSTNISIARGGKDINVGEASKGEMLGEMSLLLSGQSKDIATASVIAIDNADVIAIDKTLLREKINVDKGFCYRFYLSISRMLSFRLRDQLISSSLGIKNINSNANNLGIDNDELDLEILSKLSYAGSKFDSFCRRYS